MKGRFVRELRLNSNQLSAIAVYGVPPVPIPAMRLLRNRWQGHRIDIMNWAKTACPLLGHQEKRDTAGPYFNTLYRSVLARPRGDGTIRDV